MSDPRTVARGRLLGLGVGPGDPELITVKALRFLKARLWSRTSSRRASEGNAFGIIEAHLAKRNCVCRSSTR